MKNHFAVALLLFASTAYAGFAEYIYIGPHDSTSTPPPVLIERVDSGTVRASMPNLPGPKSYWLIRCKEPLTDQSKLNFRKALWEHLDGLNSSDEVKDASVPIPLKLESRPDVELISQVDSTAADERVIINIPLSEISRTYIYRDFSSPVRDGGLYSGYDLPEFYKAYQKAK